MGHSIYLADDEKSSRELLHSFLASDEMCIRDSDMITPREVEYTFSLLFDDRTISILAYNLETVLAEKLETVLSRNLSLIHIFVLSAPFAPYPFGRWLFVAPFKNKLK